MAVSGPVKRLIFFFLLQNRQPSDATLKERCRGENSRRNRPAEQQIAYKCKERDTEALRRRSPAQQRIE